MHMNKKRKILTVVALAVFGAIVLFHYLKYEPPWALASMVSALIGGCIWIKASTARVTDLDDRYYIGGDMRGKYKGQEIWVNSTSMKKAR